MTSHEQYGVSGEARSGTVDWSGIPEAVAARFDRKLASELVLLRRDLHQYPELSFQEERTATRLMEALEATGVARLERVAGTGVVARIAGTQPGGPTVAVRGDIDALPIHERTGLPYSSAHDGVMHACGHDVHASWAVGAARLLAQRPAVGDVVIVLQPAEEVGEGAPKILESGALDGVSAIFGAHVDRRFAVGEVVAEAGPMAAAADAFEIRVRGEGGHGARPQLTRDPIVAAAHLVSALQTIVSRRVDPGSPAVVTVGSFQAGSAANVIPDEAVLKGTLRSVDSETRKLLESELRHITASVGATHHVECKVTVFGGSPPIVNDQQATDWARHAARRILGEEALVPYGSVNMGGEDFAFYLEEIPGCFLRIGAREADGEVIGAHTPQFYAAEGSLFVGAAVLAETARVASEQLAAQS